MMIPMQAIVAEWAIAEAARRLDPTDVAIARIYLADGTGDLSLIRVFMASGRPFAVAVATVRMAKRTEI